VFRIPAVLWWINKRDIWETDCYTNSFEKLRFHNSRGTGGFYCRVTLYRLTDVAQLMMHSSGIRARVRSTINRLRVPCFRSRIPAAYNFAVSIRYPFPCRLASVLWCLGAVPPDWRYLINNCSRWNVSRRYLQPIPLRGSESFIVEAREDRSISVSRVELLAWKGLLFKFFVGACVYFLFINN